MGAEIQDTGLAAHVKTTVPPNGRCSVIDLFASGFRPQRQYQSAFVPVYSAADCQRPSWVPARMNIGSQNGRSCERHGLYEADQIGQVQCAEGAVRRKEPADDRASAFLREGNPGQAGLGRREPQANRQLVP